MIVCLCVVFEVAQEAPAIVSTSVTSTSVHVRWTSPFFVGAPLIGYRLSVTALDASDQLAAGTHGGGGGGRRMEWVKEVLVSNTAAQRVMSEVVTLLQADTDYVVNVAALNQFGAGVSAAVTVHTLSHSVGEFAHPSTSDDQSFFIFARDSIYAIARICYRPSVRLSVRLSHGWISQKRLKLGSCNFHHQVAP